MRLTSWHKQATSWRCPCSGSGVLPSTGSRVYYSPHLRNLLHVQMVHLEQSAVSVIQELSAAGFHLHKELSAKTTESQQQVRSLSLARKTSWATILQSNQLMHKTKWPVLVLVITKTKKQITEAYKRSVLCFWGVIFVLCVWISMYNCVILHINKTKRRRNQCCHKHYKMLNLTKLYAQTCEFKEKSV